MREVDVGLAPPGGHDLARVQRDAAAIHGAGIELPRAGALFHGSARGLAVAQALHIEIARAIELVAPHDREFAVAERHERGMAALADGPIVELDILRPRRAGVVRKSAPEALATRHA